MKSPLPFGGRCLTAGMLACLSSTGISSAGDLDIPRGTLTVDREWIRIGTKSQLAWKIDYPTPVKSVVDVVPPNVIQPKKDLKMKVRVLGASFQQAKSNNGHGNNADGVDSSNPGQGSGGPNGAFDLSLGIDDELKGFKTTYLPVEVLWSLNGAPWTQVFYGNQTKVNPSKVLVDSDVKGGNSINFAVRGWRDGAWLPLYHTAANTSNVVVLKDGDKVPSTVPALNGSTIESFLKPYMDPGNKTVKVGDRDLILLFELGQTSIASSGFDLQDLVILVTFQ